MSNLKTIYILLASLVFLGGCSQSNVNNTTIEKTKIKKEKIVKKKVIKKTISYKYCSKHTKAMTHALNYVQDEFEKGYFLQKDLVGAKAQLFLIQNKSSSIFAQNINAAQDSYLKHYSLAKKNRCNITKYRVSPLKRIEYKIKRLEKQKDKK